MSVFSRFTDTLRKQAWPKLLGLHSYHDSELEEKPEFAPCKDTQQIELDVCRCTWHLLTGSQRAQRLQMEYKRNKKVAKLIQRKQTRLANLINSVLVRKSLNYYQGFHDISCIVMATVGGSSSWSASRNASRGPLAGLDMSAQVLSRLTQWHLKDYMQSSFQELNTLLHLSLFPLLALVDPQVHDHLTEASMEPMFCVSWIITWFSHEVRDTELVKRLFDVLIVSHPLMPIYLSIAMLTHPVNRVEILATECEFTELHQTLTNLPKNSSCVGWKYCPGDGYVSDDGTEEESSVSSFESIDGDDFCLQLELESYPMDDVPDPTLVSLTTGPPTEVPFQVLIDKAIELMDRVTPDQILNLTKRYYGREYTSKLLAGIKHISMFQERPSWTIEDKAKPDWLLKKEAREAAGYASLSRRQKRQRKGKPKLYSPIERGASKAKVAAGFGLGEKERKRRMKRMLRFGGAFAAVASLVAISLWIFYSTKFRIQKNVESDL